MGRILFPTAGETFGYERVRRDVDPNNNSVLYGPQQIAQALAVAETASEHFAKPVARGLLHLRQPQHGTPVNDQWVADRQAQGIPLTDAQAKPGALQQETPLPPTLVRRPVIAGSPGVPRHEDVVAYERAMQAQAQAQAQAAAAAQQAPAGAAQAPQGAQPPAQVQNAPQAGGGAAQPGDAERLAKLKDTMKVVNETLAEGRPMTPRAKQRIAQIQAEIQALEARSSPQQPNLNPQATLATQKDGTVVATPQDPYLPGMGQPVANRADAQAAALRPNEYQLNVQADRKHSLPELQALIQAAKATGRQEDLAAAQQAIMSAPLDDAEPTDWVDIFTEFAGGKGFHRERQRQALLKELAPPAHGGLDSWRIANIESQINRRATQDDYTREQENKRAMDNATEPMRQLMNLENQIQDNAKKQLEVAQLRFGVGTSKFKQAKAKIDADMQRELNNSLIAWRQQTGAAAVERAHAATQHESPTDVHQPLAGGGLGFGGKIETDYATDLVKQTNDAAMAALNAAEAAMRDAPTTTQRIKSDPMGGLGKARTMSGKDELAVAEAREKLNGMAATFEQNLAKLETIATNPKYAGRLDKVIASFKGQLVKIKETQAKIGKSK